MIDLIRPIVRFKKLRDDAIIPTQKSADASGFDLHALYHHVLARDNSPIVVTTGIAVEIPQGWEGQIRSRSGLAANKGIFVVNSPGTIDSDYRGELMVILGMLLRDEEFMINPGDRIAQLVICSVAQPVIEVVTALSDTARGAGGLGSTGV